MTEDRKFSVMAYPSHHDTLSNPYIRLLYAEAEQSTFEIQAFSIRRALVGRADVVHIHWPEWAIVQRSPFKAYPRLIAFMAAIFLARARGAAVVWTVHNLHPHRRVSRLREALLYAFLRRAVDHQIHLTDATRGEMEDTRHAALIGRWNVIEHGPLASGAEFPPQGGFRRKQGVPADASMIAFFGGIDRYKGVPALIRAFGELDDPSARLAICGRFADRGIQDDVVRTALPDDRIVVRAGFLSDEDLAELVVDADLVVLPYAAGLNSGSVFYALSSGCPVLVPATRTFLSVAKAVGPGWVNTYRGDITPEAIASALRTQAPGAQPHIASWADIWAQTEIVYRAAMTRRRRRASHGSSEATGA